MARRKDWALQKAAFIGKEEDVPAELWETVSTHTTERGGWLAWKHLTIDRAVSMAQGYGTHWRVVPIADGTTEVSGA